MKILIRYISLLFICGLMFTLCHTYIIGNTCKVRSYPAKGQPVKESPQSKLHENGFSFFKDVIFNIVPALKNLR
jgi:hypothetical protein